MLARRLLFAAITAVAVVAMLLSACAGSGEQPDPYQRKSCPGIDILVCTGGTVSKTGRVRDREPRICQCRPADRITH